MLKRRVYISINTETNILNYKKFYEERGAEITLCKLCYKIKETFWPLPIEGPSIDSTMVCNCNQPLKNI
jgi:hypothetical protein